MISVDNLYSTTNGVGWNLLQIHAIRGLLIRKETGTKGKQGSHGTTLRETVTRQLHQEYKDIASY